MQKLTEQDWKNTSYLSGGSAAYVEGLYESFLKDPHSVSDEWRHYFSQLPKVNGAEGADISHDEIRQYFAQLVRQPKKAQVVSGDLHQERQQRCVDQLINAYRVHGHLAAKFDALNEPREAVVDLQLNSHGLSEADLNTVFLAPDVMGVPQSRLSDIISRLKAMYCGTMGAEFMYVTDPSELHWLQNRFESYINSHQHSREWKIKILKELTAADGLEKYLGSKYPGQKRFSLEGGDSFIPFVQGIVEEAGRHNIEELVFGMAHRGRLNMLVNVMGQPPKELFQEFEGTKEYGLISGDVKYHLGYSSDVETVSGQPVHLSLAFNPSHLEVISAVVLGSVRARHDRHRDGHGTKAMAVLVHGDAAISGQGVVMETVNMSKTRAYSTRGSIHIVINNQVGFTTSFHDDARSSRYCTDIAKLVNAPVFHVNADDPEAVVFLAKLAVDYRQKFKKDIFVDIMGYRRHGHNEADEPMATQPRMYQIIKSHLTPRELYASKLIAEGVITQSDVDKMMDDYRAALDKGETVVRTTTGAGHKLTKAFVPYLNQDWQEAADTTVTATTIKKLGTKLFTLPEGFTVQRQVGGIINSRLKMVSGELPFDWGCAENLAYATLLNEGYNVRISGQDCRRGTFAHRHAALHDQVTGECIVPMEQFNSTETKFQIYDSLLSEFGVVGFEYGYGMAAPHGLVIWEAQFGDFANGAQVVIDQFLSSSWQKWNRVCGLVLLLPHGYEGMGPEHSSARLERFLQLCAQDNMQVCVPSTPAQVFHMLRRQVIRPYRKPLIVMSPKSLLRHKLAVSTMEELTGGHFQTVISEVDQIKVNSTRKIILCSGKVYYDLLEERRAKNITDIAIIRIEQLYPFPAQELKSVLAEYKNTSSVVWCQEEPQNQGAWYSSQHHFLECLTKNQTLSYAGRLASAAPAVGYPALHKQQQVDLVNEALS
jgi:2-oxoglutarate dehydrogenase E1 component